MYGSPATGGTVALLIVLSSTAQHTIQRSLASTNLANFRMSWVENSQRLLGMVPTVAPLNIVILG
jgi:hypothetical protein